MNAPNTLAELQRQYAILVRQFDVEPHVAVLHTTRQDDGSPHIELHGNSFDYVVTERGSEWSREQGLSLDDVLYLLLKSVTGHVAMKQERITRITRVGEIDGRSVWFPLQESLMGQLRAEWGARLQEEHRLILLRHPFKDYSPS
ncbi:hypothetical protein GN316_05265 [Xylophilus sp. Kf1]|nr:hypothetical protein [Xylophilus sp. Kf1]